MAKNILGFRFPAWTRDYIAGGIFVSSPPGKTPRFLATWVVDFWRLGSLSRGKPGSSFETVLNVDKSLAIKLPRLFAKIVGSLIAKTASECGEVGQPDRAVPVGIQIVQESGILVILSKR